MLMRAIGLVGVLGIFITLFLGGDAGAQSAETPGDQSTGSSAPEPAVPQQEATLEGEVGGLTEVGSQLEDAPAQADAAAARTQELDQQTQKLSKDLEAQREAAAASKARFEQRVRAAYKGQDLAGISLVLNSVLGGDAKLDTILNSPAVRMLLKGRESIQRHKESQQT